MNRRLTSTDCSLVKNLTFKGQNVFEREDIVRNAVEKHLGKKYADFFASPEKSGGKNSVDWYSCVEGEVRRLSDIREPEQTKYRKQIVEISDQIRQLSKKLSEGPDKARGEFLAYALSTGQAEDEVFYVVGDQPILCGWGMTKKDGKLVRPEDIVREGVKSKKPPMPPTKTGTDITPPVIVDVGTPNGTGGAEEKTKKNGGEEIITLPIEPFEDEPKNPPIGENNLGKDQVSLDRDKDGLGKREERTGIPNAKNGKTPGGIPEEDNVSGPGREQPITGGKREGPHSPQWKNLWEWLLMALLLLLVIWFLKSILPGLLNFRGSSSATSPLMQSNPAATMPPRPQVVPKSFQPSSQKSQVAPNNPSAVNSFFGMDSLDFRTGLFNEQNQPIQLRVGRDLASGNLFSEIRDGKQVCRGLVDSAAEGSNKLNLFVRGVKCPDGDSYDSFKIECNRSGYGISCRGINKNTAWDIYPIIGKEGRSAQ